jgi:hypothetical protein
MASFTISARANQDGFEIEVVAHEGAPPIETLADAEAWLVRCARLPCDLDPAGSRVLSRF